MRPISKGSTSHSEFVVLRDSTTGLGKTGLIFSDITGSYTRQRAARTSITMVTLAATTTAFTSGGFIEIDSTNCKGLYRIDVPDAAFATGVDQVVVSVAATSIITEHKEFRLVDVNDQDTVRFGMTALPNAVSGATGGLVPVVIFGGTASAGSATTLTLTGASAVDNTYNHMHLRILSGTGAGQERSIVNYVGSTKVATVGRNWTTTPDNTSVFAVIGPEAMPSWNLFQGVASAGGATSVTLSGGSATSSIYNGALVVIMAGTGARQARVCTAYNGGTGVVTVDRAWQTNPDSTSVIIILAGDLPATDGAGNVSGSFAVSTLESLNLHSGTAQTGSTSTTIKLAAGADGTTNDLYKGSIVKVYGGTGAGQARTITGYVAATRVATVDRAWAVTPDNTSTYAVLALVPDTTRNIR